MLNEWWKQLYGESEGKDGKGILPTSCVFTTDLHSLGQYIQDGEKMLNDEICKLRDKLNKSIEENADYDEIYKLSVELDELIAKYYKLKTI